MAFFDAFHQAILLLMIRSDPLREEWFALVAPTNGSFLQLCGDRLPVLVHFLVIHLEYVIILKAQTAMLSCSKLGFTGN